MTDNSNQAAMGGASGEVVGADLGVRFLARLIDGLLFFVVILILAVILGAIFGGSATPFGFGISFASIIGAIIYAALYIGYYAYMESSRGQTVGKMAMKIKTVGPDGQNPTMEEAAKRNLWYAIGIIPFLGGILSLVAVIAIAVTISNSPTKQGWHDNFAGGTRVVKVS